MAPPKKVRVCKSCSGFDVEELKGILRDDEYTTGCIGMCLHRNPHFKGQIFGFLNGDFTICNTKDEFFSKIAAII
ncbi:MAG: hypothetical protein BGN88_03995 [Clostridiales bacterium 43-6]|nr:MAG: hypothetical protein BGN88_03995 [Clostridiales bacterium 43-6]